MDDVEEIRRPKFRGLRGVVGSKVFIHPCSICGHSVASFGIGFSSARKEMGTWYCGDHVPDNFWRIKNGKSE